MLVVRGAILAEWSNSGVGSGLLWKIEIGEKKDIRGGEKEEAARREKEFFCNGPEARERARRVGVFGGDSQ